MKILMVDGARGWGGAEEIVLMLSSRLRDAGHAVTILVREDSSPDTRFTAAGFSVLRFSRKGLGGVASLAVLHLQARRERFDLIHVHRNHDLIMARTLSAAAGRVPVLLTQHCLLGKTSSFLIELADRIIAVSGFIGSDMMARFPSLEEKVQVLHNGIDLRPFETPATRYWDRVPSLAGKRPLLGAVGLFYKNQEELIDMLPAIRERLPHAALVLIGRDDEKQKVLEERAALRGVSDVVWFAGGIPHESVGDALAGLDLNVSAFRTEGFGLTVAEGFAVGTPFVGYRAGSYPELIVDGVTGRLADDQAAFVEAVVSLVEDAPTLQEMRRRAREDVFSRFALERMVSRYEEVYAAMTGKGQRG